MDSVVIVGAGAMGCLFAARLALAGRSVTVVDIDRERLDLIARNGIVLDDDSGRHIARVDAKIAAEAIGPVDLLVLFTKGMHSAAAIRSVAHLIESGCPVLTLQNGLGNADCIARYCPVERILWGVTDFPADLDPPNSVKSHGQGHIFLGNFPRGANTSARVVAAMLSDAGLGAVADPDVGVAVWEKVAFNAALNALCTASGLPVGGLDCAAGRRAAGVVVEEIAEIAASEGISVNHARLAAKVEFALTHHQMHKPSMLQDRLAGRGTEIETINGAVLDLARKNGVTAPALQVLTDLVRLGENPR